MKRVHKDRCHQKLLFVFEIRSKYDPDAYLFGNREKFARGVLQRTGPSRGLFNTSALILLRTRFITCSHQKFIDGGIIELVDNNSLMVSYVVLSGLHFF